MLKHSLLLWLQTHPARQKQEETTSWNKTLSDTNVQYHRTLTGCFNSAKLKHCKVLPLQLIIVQEHALQPRDLLHGSQHDFARCRQAATLTGHYNRANRGAVSNANINSLSILLDQLQRISVHIKHKCTGVWVWWQHLQNKVQSTRRRPSLSAMTAKSARNISLRQQCIAHPAQKACLQRVH